MDDQKAAIMTSSSAVSENLYQLPRRENSGTSAKKEDISCQENAKKYSSLAKTFYKERHFNQAIDQWDKAIDLGYLFPEKEMRRYISSMGLSGKFQEEYALWTWLFDKHPQKIKPEWFGRYAIAAHNTDRYNDVIVFGKRAIFTSETGDPILYALIADACYALKKYDQAEQYFQEYFSSVAIEDFMPVYASRYAEVCYKLKKYKTASHYKRLYLNHADPHEIVACDYAAAAIYAFRNDEYSSAQEFWEKYFSCDPRQQESEHLAIAGDFYSQQENFTRSNELLEAYFKTAKKEFWNRKYVLILGHNYHMTNKHKQACKWYNSIFLNNDIQEGYLKDLPPAVYCMIAQSYLLAGDSVKAKKLLKLLYQNYPQHQVMLAVKHEEVSLPANSKRGKSRGRGAASRSVRAVRAPAVIETPAQRIKALLKASTLEKCDEALHKLNLIALVDAPETRLYQEEHLRLVGKGSNT